MIKVKRHDYKARTIHGRNYPASYECFYRNDNGITLAWYSSKEDCLYLNSDCIDRNNNFVYDRNLRDLPLLERMTKCYFSKEYNELIHMLNINEDTTLGEFVNPY